MKTIGLTWLCRNFRGVLVAAAATSIVTFGATVWADETNNAGFQGSTTIFGDGLEDLRGGDADTTISIQNTQNLTASVEQVTISADSILTGAVDIGDHAFDNFSGVGMFNMVTGNNNAVNSAVEVTFTLE